MSEEYDSDFEDEDMLERRLSATDNLIQENEETIILVWFKRVVVKNRQLIIYHLHCESYSNLFQ
jgi:hypothetical protein